MKRKAKKVIAAALVTALSFQTLPLTQYGNWSSEVNAESEQLRTELAAKTADYPEGAFAFYTATSDTAEGDGDITVKVVRMGGTASAASVDIKAVDVTAKYGEDYSVYVADGMKKLLLEEKETEEIPVPETEAQTEAAETEAAETEAQTEAAETEAQTG